MFKINTIITKGIPLLLLLNSCFLLIPNKSRAFPIVMLVLFTIVFYFKNRITKINFKFLLINSIVYLLFISSCLYTENIQYALKKLETTSSLFVFPFVFTLLLSTNFTLLKKEFDSILFGFCVSVLTFLIVSFIYFWNQEFTFFETIIHYSNLVDIRLGHYRIHPIYLSIYTGTGMLFLIRLQNSYKRYMFLWILIAILFLVFLAILGRRGPVISLFIIGIIQLFLRLNVYKIIFGVLATALFVFSLVYIPKYQDHNRFKDLYDGTILKDPSSSLSIRYHIYKCDFSLIKESPLIGYGIGDVQKKLNDCYNSIEIVLPTKIYSSHNQFIGIALISGCIGLLIYAFSLYYNIKKTLEVKSYFTFAFIIFLLANSFTENILEREHGVLLYAFFTSLFLFTIEKEKSKIT